MNFNVNLGGGFSSGVGGHFVQEPIFEQVSVGQGIDQREYQSIIICCKQAYMQRMTPYSKASGQLIKQNLGGEWFVIVSGVQNKKFDFSITSVEGGDYLIFSLDQTLFQVVKIKGQNYGFR